MNEWSVDPNKIETIGFAQVSRDGVIQKCNMAFAGIVGRDVGSVVGMQVLDLTFKDDRAASAGRIKDLMSSETERIVTQKRYELPNGDFVWAQLESVKDNGLLLSVVHRINSVSAERIELEQLMEKVRQSLGNEMPNRSNQNIEITTNPSQTMGGGPNMSWFIGVALIICLLFVAAVVWKTLP